MKRDTYILFIAVGLVVLGVGVFASVPHLINYQGVLTDSGGSPITDTHDLTFTIYPDSAGSAPVYWTETHVGVLFNDGLFHVILGGTTPIPDSLFASSPRWIGIAVDATAELKPRQQITSVPWAFRAAVADSALSGGGAGNRHSLDAADGDPVDAVYVNDFGYVGIGTKSPTAQLDLRLDRDMATSLSITNESTGNNSSESLRFRDENGGSVHITAYDVNHSVWPGGLVIETERSGGSLWFKTAGANRMSVLNNGNVGIGTSSATEKLQVAGTIHSTNGGFRFPDGTLQTTADAGDEGLSLPFADSASVAYSAFTIKNEDAGGTAIKGENKAVGNYGQLGTGDQGVFGQHYNGHNGRLGGVDYGVFGQNASGHWGALGGSAWGIYGRNANGSRGYIGHPVYGVAGYSDTVGVHGGNSVTGDYGRLGMQGYGAYGRSATGHVGTLGSASVGALGGHANGNNGLLGGETFGVYGAAPGGGSAGYFAGNVVAEDTIQMSGFKMQTGASDGYVLASDATGVGSWQSLSVLGDGGWQISGDDMYSDVTGNVGIGTSNPGAPLHVAEGQTVLFGADTTGAGTRLVWFPAKSAFRAGKAFAGGWDSANVGEGSVAMGEVTEAAGHGSTAMGSGASASGDYSTAMGRYTTASSDFCTAMGLYTTASATYSTAMGHNTTASGAHTTAMGHGTKAEAYSSTAIGRYNVGGGSIGTWVTDDPLFEIGNGSSDIDRSNAVTVLKNGNVGVGIEDPLATLHVEGDVRMTGFQLPVGASDGLVLTSNAFGQASWQPASWVVDGDWAISGTDMYPIVTGNVGIGTTSPLVKLHVASGDTVLFGENMSGVGSKLMWIPSKSAFRAGYGGSSWEGANVGQNSFAAGSYTEASGGNSTAFGQRTQAAGIASTAMGLYTYADSYGSTAIGRYNVGGGSSTGWADADPLFEIGNGDGPSPLERANAMTVLKNGNVGIKTPTPTYLLEVGEAGDGTEARANAWNLLSSIEFKENIESLTPSDYREVLAKVQNTDVVRYQFSNDEKRVQHIGVIAENSPREIVAPDGKAVSLGDYCAFLLAAIKAQQEQIEDLKGRIVKLESEISDR